MLFVANKWEQDLPTVEKIIWNMGNDVIGQLGVMRWIISVFVEGNLFIDGNLYIQIDVFNYSF